MVRFLVVGDLHGRKPIIKDKNFDAIICPGDIAGDYIKKYIFKALRENAKNPEKYLRWYDLVGMKDAKKLIQDSIIRGRNSLEYLNSFNVPIFTVPGNWDVGELGIPYNKWSLQHYRKMKRD